MTCDKPRMMTEELSNRAARRILSEFPEVLTEVRAPDGSVRSAIDFELLKTLLGDHVGTKEQERYQLSWPGKREAQLESNTPVSKTLRPDLGESNDFEQTRNIFIQGDNLDGLKLITESYLGMVDMIYIDPPYNTGSDLIYKDRFFTSTTEHEVSSGERSEGGERLVTNAQSNGRFHSDWLSMMYPRLRLARQLLADHGLIFISIDDNERANLEKICEEIFGRDNLVGCFVWKRRSGAMDAVTNLSEDHEYVLVYSKMAARLRGIERTFEKYTNPDNDPRGDWIADNLSAGKPGGDTYYPITDPATGHEYLPPRGRYWPYSRQTMAQKIAEGRVIFPKTPGGTPMLKRFASEAMKPTIPVSSWIERPGSNGGQSTLFSPMNSSATKAMKELFGDKIFSFPKPVELIKALIEQGAPSDGLILDFFAGSGTTAQAVFECNAKDGGNRRFILIQFAELVDRASDAFKNGFPDIAAIARERIRRSGQNVIAGDCHAEWRRDIGFRAFKVDSSNFRNTDQEPEATLQSALLDAVENIEPDRSGEDLLFQMMLDWGFDLALPVVKRQLDGRNVFLVGGDALAACFDGDGRIDEAFVKELAKLRPRRALFRDSGFKDSAVKINVTQIFKLLSPGTEVKCI